MTQFDLKGGKKATLNWMQVEISCDIDGLFCYVSERKKNKTKRKLVDIFSFSLTLLYILKISRNVSDLCCTAK